MPKFLTKVHVCIQIYPKVTLRETTLIDQSNYRRESKNLLLLRIVIKKVYNRIQEKKTRKVSAKTRFFLQHYYLYSTNTSIQYANKHIKNTLDIDIWHHSSAYTRSTKWTYFLLMFTIFTVKKFCFIVVGWLELSVVNNVNVFCCCTFFPFSFDCVTLVLNLNKVMYECHTRVPFRRKG